MRVALGLWQGRGISDVASQDAKEIMIMTSYRWRGEIVTCKTCNGTGRDKAGWQCWRCGGKGDYMAARLERIERLDEDANDKNS